MTAVRELADDARAALAAALAALKAADDPGAPAVPRGHLEVAAAGLKSEAAKLGFLFAQPQAPSAAAAAGLLRALRDAAAALCALLAAAAARGGPTLRRALHQTGEVVVNSCVELVGGAARAAEGGPAERAVLPRAAAVCMERCDAAAKAPLDDQTAIGRATALVARQIQDAAAELAGAVDEARMEAEADDDVAEADGEAVGPAATGVIRSVQGILEAAVDVLRAAMRALLDGGAAAAAGAEAWESALFHVKQLAAAADEAAAGAYPPYNAEELVGDAGAVVTGCELICEELDLGGAALARAHAAQGELERQLAGGGGL
jgi:hypothetical protein